MIIIKYWAMKFCIKIYTYTQGWRPGDKSLVFKGEYIRRFRILGAKTIYPLVATQVRLRRLRATCKVVVALGLVGSQKRKVIMDSSSFKQTPKSLKNHFLTFWSTFLDNLSKINDLKERLATLQNMKLRLEKEGARRLASGSEPFTMSIEYLIDAITYLQEEEKSMIKDMRKFQNPSACMDMSQNPAKAEEAALQGLCFARKKTNNGIPSLVKVSRDESNVLRNSSSLYTQQRPMVQMGVSRDKQMMMPGRREANGISSTVKRSRDQGSSYGSSNSVYSQQLQMIRMALARFEESMAQHQT